jgi:hypothetical protein
MHSINNILESNKIDTQSRADTYIRRTRLISKSDYNLNLDEPKSICETEKNPKNPLVWAKKPKKTQKNPKKTKTNPKNPKKPTGLGFFKKTRVFSNPGSDICKNYQFGFPRLKMHHFLRKMFIYT